MGQIYARVEVILTNNTTCKIKEVQSRKESGKWYFHPSGDEKQFESFTLKAGQTKTAVLYPRRAASGAPFHLKLIFEDGSYDDLSISTEWAREYICAGRQKHRLPLEGNIKPCKMLKKLNLDLREMKISGYFIVAKSEKTNDYEIKKSLEAPDYAARIYHKDHEVIVERPPHDEGSCVLGLATKASISITIQHTKQQLADIEAEKLHQRGVAEISKKNYTKAIQILKKAHEKSTNRTLRDSFDVDLYKAYKQQSFFDYEKALLLEKPEAPTQFQIHNDFFKTSNKLQDKHRQTMKKELLNSARHHAEEALRYRHQDVKELEDLLKQIELRIAAALLRDKSRLYFSAGMKLAKEAHKHDDNNKYNEACEKLTVARDGYQKILTKLERVRMIDQGEMEKIEKIVRSVKNLLKRVREKRLFEAQEGEDLDPEAEEEMKQGF